MSNVSNVPLVEALAGNVNPQVASSEALGSWRQTLPILTGLGVTLRELRMSDAASLFTLLASDEVSRYMSEPPGSIEGFERFVSWAHRERAAGRYACFAVTLVGYETAIGVFQVRLFESDPGIGEWGFAIGVPYWGSGVFQQGAELLIEFAFEVMNVNRLEARVVVQNSRGVGALHKVGAVEEARLQRSLCRKGEYFDQFLFAIVREDGRAVQRPQIH
jgi:ribosomal-protein-alanine N-acetyltransferase